MLCYTFRNKYSFTEKKSKLILHLKIKINNVTILNRNKHSQSIIVITFISICCVFYYLIEKQYYCFFFVNF